jgi:hypothetical protein
VKETGGTIRSERLPEKWAAGLRELFRAAQPPNVHREPATVRFFGPLATLGPIEVSPWNQTWPKTRAAVLAEAQLESRRVPMVAQWNFGEGRVAAAAFGASGDIVEAIAKLVERPPRDPRFKVAWDARQSPIRVSVDAVRDGAYLNGDRLTLELFGPADDATAAKTLRVPQTAPGRYELSLDSPSRASFARVRSNEQTLDTVALAGRYASEFDDVGTDRAALAALARLTGGAVIQPGVTRRLDLPRPRRLTSLVSWLATAGAALLAGGLVRWRVGS